ncbi:MAG: Tim44 domain-containing protein [Clostridia bacterium]|nr:Tim44 domain-containing protein [Clostridia bacterium]
MKRKILLLLLAAAVVASLLLIPAFGDVGNNDFGFDDAGDDWGGDGGGSLVDIAWMIALFSDHPVIAIIAVVVIVVLVLVGKKKNGSGVPAGGERVQRSTVSTAPANVRPEAEVVAAVQAVDPAFSSEEFKTYAQDAYIKVQEAWEAKNFELVRSFETDALFSLHRKQMQEYRDQNKTNHLDAQCIHEITLAAFSVDDKNEVLTVRLCASYLDYVTDDSTGRVIGGSRDVRVRRTYRIDFMRTKGVKTDSAKHMTTAECPSCGAPVNVSATGICEYCKNVIVNGQYGWVMNRYSPW